MSYNSLSYLSKSIRVRVLIAAFAFFVCMFAGINVQAQTTTFTYQGRINDGGPAASGPYDFIFRLYNLAGVQIGTDFPSNGVQVTNGIFTVQLDFTAPNAFDGSPRLLEIAVKKPADPSFTTLSPRQPITSVPYSIKSLNAVNASNAVNATNATQLGGVAANQYVLTGDSRMTDARNPLAGSTNYIQNQNAVPQAASNFNISGTGKAATFNAVTQYNIGGDRVLSIDGFGVTFVGRGAGSANTGGNNSFFGNEAGESNLNGGSNTFIGFQSGKANTTGARNSFFGAGAGLLNTTGGENAFFGDRAGLQNTTGIRNDFFGRNAGLANTTGTNNSFFGDEAGFSNTIATHNSFFGRGAGFSTTTGGNNSFFGNSAGVHNTTGAGNSVFGEFAGFSTTTGTNNAFFGRSAGFSNTTGSNNSAFGKDANIGSGPLNYATAIGSNAGASASDTIVLGKIAGTYNGVARPADTVVVPGALNVVGNSSFTGTLAANIFNATSQYNIGGDRVLKTDADHNTLLGELADVGIGSLTFATALGSHAVVETNDTIVLGKVAGTYNSVARPADAVVVPGHLYRQYTAAARSAAIPLAYGSVAGTGTILSGTGNFTLVHTGAGLYDITITGETYSNAGFTVTITPVTNSPRITAVADVGTAFRVNMWDLAGSSVDNAFHFTIWKPNPN